MSGKITRKRLCSTDKQLFIGKIKDFVVKSVAKKPFTNDSVNEVTNKQKIYKWNMIKKCEKIADDTQALSVYLSLSIYQCEK